jgi:hypothetical protein
MIAASSSVIPSSRRHPDRRRRTLPPQWRACPERGGAESNAPPAFRFCLFFAVVRVPHPSRPCLMRWVGCTPPIHRRKGTRIGVPGERSLLVGVILRVPNRPSPEGHAFTRADSALPLCLRVLDRASDRGRENLLLLSSGGSRGLQPPE